MFKDGDRVVITAKDMEPYGKFGEIVVVRHVNEEAKELIATTSFKNEMWHFAYEDVVTLELWNSPLMKALREE